MSSEIESENSSEEIFFADEVYIHRRKKLFPAFIALVLIEFPGICQDDLMLLALTRINQARQANKHVIRFPSPCRHPIFKLRSGSKITRNYLTKKFY